MALPRRDLAVLLLRHQEWTPHLPPDWYADALCAQIDDAIFYPDKGESTRDAKKVCGACPVRELCLEYALDRQERHGIWGGLSDRERRKIERQRKAA